MANSKLDALYFHAVNILLYAILCIVSLPTFQVLLKNKFDEIGDDTAFLSSLLFTVHPIHAEVVASIVGRADILSSILFFISFLLYKRTVHRRSFVYLCIVILCIAAATLCKETAITALVSLQM